MPNTDISRINLPRSWLSAFCKRNQIVRLSLFGSVLRDDFHDGSDVDVLVEYAPDSKVGYLEMMRMQRELSDKIGRPVDLRTPAELSKYFREQVIREAAVACTATG